MFKRVDPRVDFPSLENQILKKWQETNLSEKYLSKNKNSSKKFKFIDGPITANNPMGVHHAWGRTYKDLWQRFFNMKGYRQRFQNGFDEQGLWIEVEVEKELGLKTKKDIENLVPGDVSKSIAKFVSLCKERVKKFSRVQTEQSKRLGYFMDWENSYHTSSDENNYAIWHYLKTIHEKGWLYKGRDSVPWCPRCGTAISQHEILTEEYKEITHKAVFVKYPILNQDFSLLVWTTTPWTLPGNVAVAVNPDFNYEVWELNGEKVLISNEVKDRVAVTLEKTGELGNFKNTKRTFKGEALLQFKYKGPFDDFERVKKARESNLSTFHKIISAKDLVTAEEGTGLVHIAPGAGGEDFKLSQEEKLSVIELIDEEAVYIKGLGEFSGKNAKKHPEIILDYLKKTESGKYFFEEENYKHRYPTCWRCKTELVWRVVDEWYIAMDKPSNSKVKIPPLPSDRQKSNLSKKTYREQMKEVIKKIDWIPKWGYDRELDWLNNMHDWLISKKRYWGLALPIWECSKCGNFEVVGSKDELKKRAISGYEKFEGNSPHRPWIDEVKIKCSKCAGSVSRVEDVGNVWLDAGVVPFSTIHYFSNKDFWKEWFPADFITESFAGQFKNWFYSLIAMATALENTTSFKTLLGHGQVRDEKGEEMHKSKGNAIWFDEAAERIGVDVMRWVYLRSNPEHNVNFGYHGADSVRRFFHLRLWNVYSFFLTYASIDRWKPEKGKFVPEHVLDSWILSRMNGSIKNIEESLEKYDANRAAETAEIFVVNDLSNWYVRRIRDRVGPGAVDSKDKKAALRSLWLVLTTYSKVLAPMIPFITDEMYSNLVGDDSVHLQDWPEPDEKLINDNLEKQMQQAREIVEVVHSIRKENEIKVRQPLAKLSYKAENRLDPQVEDVISGEVNIKEVIFDGKQKKEIVLDLNITEELKKEGEVRDLIRKIQEKRKETGVSFDDKVNVYLPTWPPTFEQTIKRETLAKELIKSPEIKIEKV